VGPEEPVADPADAGEPVVSDSEEAPASPDAEAPEARRPSRRRKKISFV